MVGGNSYTQIKWQKMFFMSRKLAFRNPFTIDDFGLENGNNMVRFSLVSGGTLSE